MKILELHFKNLNSLYGAWSIDFTNPEYVANGLFALTGPTGAGKSTILDAICLSLYGATPRLGRITKSGNEIMSRQTGECYAEVLFESQSGRFRCHWSQHRARKKAAAELQNPRHEIAEGDGQGRVIEHQLRQVQTAVEKATGMDFDRFTRSILLAQGGFDTFLRADVEQKSKILEQITGTGIYSEISRRVHERQRDEREQLNLLQAEISGISILDPEQEEAMRNELEVKQKKEQDSSNKVKGIEEAINWLKTIAVLKQEIAGLIEDTETLQHDIEDFKPDRARLDLANKAASLEAAYASLIALRGQQKEDQKALKDAEDRLPELESSAKKQETELREAEKRTTKAKEELKNALPLIQKVRALDQKLVEKQKTITEIEDSYQKNQEKIEIDRRAYRNEQTKRTQAEKTLQQAEFYLAEQAQDKWLIAGLAGIEEQLHTLKAKQQEVAEREADQQKVNDRLDQAISTLNESTKQTERHQQKLEAAEKALQLGREDLSRLLGDRPLREYRQDKDQLLREIAFLKKIAALEDYRDQLHDSQPCPLCGSKEHPFAEEQVPVPDDTEEKIRVLDELINNAEKQETLNRQFEEGVATARGHLIEARSQQTAAAHEEKSADQARMEMDRALEKSRVALSDLQKAVLDRLKPLGIDKIPEDVTILLTALKKRLSTWQEQVEKKTAIEKELSRFDSEMKRLNAVIAMQSNALEEKLKQLETLKEERSTDSENRQGLYADKQPDVEERRLNQTADDEEKAEKAAQAQHAELQQQVSSAKTHIQNLQERVERRKPELKKADDEFTAALKMAGFADEKRFLNARLTVQERDELTERAKKLDGRQIELKAKQKERETRLEKESAKQVTEQTLEDLEPDFKESQASLQTLRDAVANLTYQLKDNARNKERIKEKEAGVAAQKKECRRWERLHGLIGSSDGKKYRNFAQGLTFELMISHANRQLEKMTDRYLLIRDDEQPLELNVIDNYQAGEIRSTRNLSGGESFIVSLTLALGLSKMASRKVRVDSLFLDEGFGTLDEEALDTALETLSGLQQDGKLIGVISHVQELKERISTRIEVVPRTGGRSLLQGPGVQQGDRHGSPAV